MIGLKNNLNILYFSFTVIQFAQFVFYLHALPYVKYTISAFYVVFKKYYYFIINVVAVLKQGYIWKQLFSGLIKKIFWFSTAR